MLQGPRSSRSKEVSRKERILQKDEFQEKVDSFDNFDTLCYRFEDIFFECLK